MPLVETSLLTASHGVQFKSFALCLLPPFQNKKPLKDFLPGISNRPHTSPHEVSLSALFVNLFFICLWFGGYRYIVYSTYNDNVIHVKLFFVDSHNSLNYFKIMGKRIYYNTTMDEDLMKEFKILAIRLSKRQNELLAEAIRDLLKKYEKKVNE